MVSTPIEEWIARPKKSSAGWRREPYRVPDAGLLAGMNAVLHQAGIEPILSVALFVVAALLVKTAIPPP